MTSCIRYRPLPFTHFYPPQNLIFGDRCAFSLSSILEELEIRSVLLVCGRNLSSGQILDPIISGSSGRIAHVWNGVRPHAPMDTIDEGAQVYKDIGADGIVSLGGGSAHDTMRGIALAVRSQSGFREHFTSDTKAFAAFDMQRNADRVQMIAIPSTLSAAETTYGGGATSEGRKYVFFGRSLFIDRIVLDPYVFATTPPDVLVSTGLNAINHAVERLCSPKHQPIGDAAFIHALRLLIPSLPLLQRDVRPSDAALSDAMLGAHLSESTNVLGGIGHAVAHVLGGRYGLPHGIAHGLGMIPGLRFSGPRNPAGVMMIHRVLTELNLVEISDDPLDAVIQAFMIYLRTLHLPARLRDVGIASDNIPAIAKDVMGDVSAGNAAREDLNLATVTGLLQTIW